MDKEKIIKLYLKYSEVFDEIKGSIEGNDNLYFLCTNKKKIEFKTLGDLEKTLRLYHKKYILTRGQIFNL